MALGLAQGALSLARGAGLEFRTRGEGQAWGHLASQDLRLESLVRARGRGGLHRPPQRRVGLLPALHLVLLLALLARHRLARLGLLGLEPRLLLDLLASFLLGLVLRLARHARRRLALLSVARPGGRRVVSTRAQGMRVRANEGRARGCAQATRAGKGT